MIQTQFDKINERLAKWRRQRHLIKTKQRLGYFGNVYEELSEYYRAKNTYDKLDAIMDIAIFTLNAFDYKYDTGAFYKKKETQEYLLMQHIANHISEIDNAITYPNLLIENLEYLTFQYGFSFYYCMIEAIKEIESRSGYYDPTINKFIKDKGAYDLKSAKKHFLLSIKYKESDDYWYFLTFKGKKKIKKWYKAKYSSCIW